MVNTKTLKLLSHPILALMLLTSINAVFATPSHAQAKKRRTTPRTAPARVFQSNTPASGILDTSYTLGGGDLIKVNVFEVPEYTGEYQVPPGGAINLPLIGSVPVLGLTTEQAADDIARRYARFLKRPIISVNLLSPRPINVLVSGEVTRPGGYSLSLQGGAGNAPGVQYPTIISAITNAQGYTLSADITQVQVRRRIGRTGEQLVSLNLQELLRTGRLPQDITLRDGDTIYIPRIANFNLASARNQASSSFAADPTRPRNVAVIGEVLRPGSYLVTSGATEAGANNPSNLPGITGQPTVMRAIQLAGGIGPRADVRNVVLRRQTRTGDPQNININLWQLLQGDIDQDTILQDGDTLFVATATDVNRAELTQLASTTLSPSKIQVGVVGEVKRAGPVDIQPNSTLNQALLAAGGFDGVRANSKAVDLVRLNPDGSVTKRVVKIDLAAGLNEQTNPVLLNNDVIIVGRNGLAKGGDTASGIINPVGGLLGVFRALFGI
ncbi:polysaccharide biosynthesis/export family protein [Brunnivagina elsteri]|uniref:Polysaccharide export protein n=1 Tax=Brunnivagina elsteri CCALA 953 TaxID=987040 RepID=A0A2A2TGP8_9CYAN|nr:polysaccharide biosynthesis/export family protein [Calothrix elsteri]PAX52846.1 polysaccharide export protein [Calothrix elsteri CCALA 953]